MLRFVYDQRLPTGGFSRREWLRVGLAALAGGVNGGGVKASEGPARRPSGFGQAKSVVFVFASGGQSQLDLWDPKPQAPLDVRGELRPISTAVPGLKFGEGLPRLARLADRFTVVRSMSHDDLDHGSAAYLALTGRYHRRLSSNPPPSPDDLPTYGAIYQRLHSKRRFLYDAIHVNGPAQVPENLAPGQNGGLLGRKFEPLVVGDCTGNAIAFAGLEATSSVLPAVRMNGRQTLKETLDRYAQTLEAHQGAVDMNHLYRRAWDMLSSPQHREAFHLGAEPASVRDRYGRHRSGQACLLARRLVEAEVPWITVVWNHSNRGQDTDPDNPELYGWDTHNDIFHALKRHLLPRFDQSFSALLEDLEQRGLLDSTLVVCMGEFGRAPRIAVEPNFKGNRPGRKHWASAYSIVMAGAGVARGAVLGATDRFAAQPTSDRYGPWDVAATMFSALGVDPTGHYRDSLERPYPVTEGKPIEPLYH